MKSNTQVYAQWLDRKDEQSRCFNTYFHIIFKEISSILLGLKRGARLLGSWIWSLK